MPSVCLYLQLHQPYRLRRYSVFDTDRHYFDDFKNAALVRQIAARCYVPAGKLLLELIQKFSGRFRFGLSITGLLLEQFEKDVPEALSILKKLAATGCVEFLGETYYHSLASLYSSEEFAAQVAQHRDIIRRLFGQETKVFRNTDLIYSNEIAHWIASLGFAGCAVQGSNALLAGRTPNRLYTSASERGLKLLTRNARLSDDIGYRFIDTSWADYPLGAEKFASWIHQIDGQGELCNLFMNYEVLGERLGRESGIFDFIADLPARLLLSHGTNFVTPSEAVALPVSGESLDAPTVTSWAEPECDVSPWLSNAMQTNALHELFKMEQPLKQRHDESMLDNWRKLGTSDHFFYMGTKYWAAGQSGVMSPYESPYDAYINFMNVIDNINVRLRP